MQPDLATQADHGIMAIARTLAQRLHLPTTLVKFLIVGGIGFLINTGMLWLFYDSPVFWFFPARRADADLLLFTHPDVRLLISSILAVEFAIISQFNMHERWTFRHRQRKGWIVARFLKFNLSAFVSPVIIVVTVNVLTPLLRDAVGPDTLLGALSPYIANGVGVLLGFTWNWTLNSLVIWPHRRPLQESD